MDSFGFEIDKVYVEVIEMAEEFRRWHCCRRCNKALTDIASLQIATSSSCKAVQRVNACKRTCSIKIGVDKGDGNLRSSTLFSRELEVTLENYNQANLEDVVTVDSEPDKVCLALLMLEPCVLRYKEYNNLITQVRFL